MTRRLCLPVLLALLGAFLTVPAAQAAPTRPRAPVDAAQARQALSSAEAAFAPADDAEPGRDTTLALRDLTLALPALRGSALRRAQALLARPTGRTAQACDDAMCVRYQPGAVAAGYPEKVLATLQDVRRAYLDAGYRAPRPDGVEGGDGRLDVYLADTGADREYGYCSPTGLRPDEYDTSAYCVLDDDFSSRQFPTNTPDENLQVTAAHEYFHAVQFGYDYAEDRWLLEATATWAEDELYPDVDDNRQYLAAGPLGRPDVPLDVFQPRGAHQYGAWIFFRYLSERVDTARQGVLPSIVRDVWDRVDARTGAPDDHSVEGVAAVLAARGTTLRTTYGRFADANRRPATTYAEGAALRYPVASPYRSVTLRTTKPSSGSITRKVDHLASSTVRLVPASTMTSSRWRVRVRVDLDSRHRATALVSSTSRSGAVTTRTLTLDAKGKGSVSVPFDVDVVRRVEVTTSNASARYTCWQGTAYSCAGRPKDDDKPYVVSATAHKR